MNDDFRGNEPLGRRRGRPPRSRDAWSVNDLAISVSHFLANDYHLTAAQIRAVGLRLLCVCEPKKTDPQQPTN